MKQIVPSSSISIAGNVVTLTGVNVPLSQILLIADTASGTILYSVAGPAPVSYTQATNSAITLASTPGGSAKLAVFYDDAASPALDGIDGSGITAPTGGSGIRGWLSGIYKFVSNPLAVFPAPVSSVSQVTNTATTSSGSTVALAANSATKLLAIMNTASSGSLYVGIGSAATTSSFVLAAGQGYEFPVIPSQAVYLLGSGSVTYSILYA